MTDDATLTLAAQGGDVAALGALLERYRPQLRAVAVRLLANEADAEDVVQDACVQALLHVREVRDPGAVGSWLVAIVGHACRARLRRHRVEQPLRGDDSLTGDLDQTVEHAALRAAVWAAIDQLSPPLRSVVLLRYFSSASSYAAIAGLCGVPVGTVRSRLHSARSLLAENLLSVAASRPNPDAALFAEETARAFGEFQTTGSSTSLAGVVAPDLQFNLFDGVRQQGRDRYASLVAADLADGVRSQPVRLTAAADMAVVELRLLNPEDQPRHCPPVLTQLHVHDGRHIRRIASHYAFDADDAFDRQRRRAVGAKPGGELVRLG